MLANTKNEEQEDNDDNNSLHFFNSNPWQLTIHAGMDVDLPTCGKETPKSSILGLGFHHKWWYIRGWEFHLYHVACNEDPLDMPLFPYSSWQSGQQIASRTVYIDFFLVFWDFFFFQMLEDAESKVHIPIANISLTSTMDAAYPQVRSDSKQCWIVLFLDHCQSRLVIIP